jgi:GGDEF domain-containing protein
MRLSVRLRTVLRHPRAPAPRAAGPSSPPAARSFLEALHHQTRVERAITLARLAVLLTVLPLLQWDALSPDSEVALTGLTAVLAGYVAVLWFVVPRLRWAPTQDFLLTVDILAATALSGFTGGIHSPLLPLLYLPILAAAARLNFRQTLLSAIAVSAVVIWMWSVTEGGMRSVGPGTLRVGLFTMGSLLLAAFFGVLGQETRLSREREELARTLQERLAQATDQLMRRLADLEFAYDLSRRLAAVTDTASVLATVAEAVRQLLAAPCAAVFLASLHEGEFTPALVTGADETEAAAVLRACAARITGATSGPAQVEVADEGPWTRAVCVPVAVGDRLLGILAAGGNQQWEPARTALATLGHVATQAGLALDRAALLEDLQRLALAKPDARLYSRDQFDHLLLQEVSRATQLGVPFAVLALHCPLIAARTATEEVELAHRRWTTLVLEAARRVDVVADNGPGSVLVLLALTNPSGARTFAARLVEAIRTDATLQRLLDADGPVEVYAGIAVFPDDAVTAAELLHGALDAVTAADTTRAIVGVSAIGL